MNDFPPDVSDLYPRQQAGFYTAIAMLALGIVAYATEGPGSLFFVMAVFWCGVGLGMLSGNTRTQRVKGFSTPRNEKRG